MHGSDCGVADQTTAICLRMKSCGSMELRMFSIPSSRMVSAATRPVIVRGVSSTEGVDKRE